MIFKLITPPAALAVSLADAKANLRVDGIDLDALITAWLEGITAHAENYTERALITQAWRVTQDGFTDDIELPRPPTISVTSVTYYDTANVLQTLAASQYVLDEVNGKLLPASGVTWPDTYARFDAVTVNYSAGYGPTDATVPKSIRLYILAKLTEQFDPAIKPEKDTVQASYIDKLLDQYRVYR